MNLHERTTDHKDLIPRLTENLIDYDIAVDDARTVLDYAVADLQRLVAARADVARRLADIVKRAV